MDIERGLRMLLNIRAALKDDNDLSLKIANMGCQAFSSVLDDFILAVFAVDRTAQTYKRVAELHKDTIDEYAELVGDLEELDDEARAQIRAIVNEAHKNADDE